MSDTFDSDEFIDYQPRKPGGPMAQIITVNGGKSEYMIARGGLHKGQRVWSIIDVNGVWYSLYWDGEKPKKGQQFNCNVTSRDYNDKTYYDAHIAGPTPEQFAQAEKVHELVKTIGNQPIPDGKGNGQAELKPSPTAQPGPSSGKIKWDDWEQIARAASELAWRLEPEPSTSPNDHAPAARLAFVNTTLIAFSNGKLELPTEAGPVSREPGEDRDERDPNLPWTGTRQA